LETFVRLVACSNCHTQYDVTDVADERFACRCGETVANQALEGVDAAVHRCGSCGAQVASDAPGCTYCGAEIIRDDSELSLICPECHGRNAEASRFCTGCGVAFAPEPVKVEGYELPCPACGCLMPPRSIGGIGINECGTCNGIWAPMDRLDQLINRAIEAQRAGNVAPAETHRPRVRGANPASQGVAYRKCPECEAFMQRRNFRKTSGVIIDRCRNHGTWLDADELEQITGFVLTGGNPVADAMMQDADRQAAAAMKSARLGNLSDDYGMNRSAYSSRGAGGLFGRTLVGVLRGLLD
jgi:Zn-finger nucleic acid-binding protein